MREREYPDSSTKMDYAYRGLKEGRISGYLPMQLVSLKTVISVSIRDDEYQALLINQIQDCSQHPMNGASCKR